MRFVTFTSTYPIERDSHLASRSLQRPSWPKWFRLERALSHMRILTNVIQVDSRLRVQPPMLLATVFSCFFQFKSANVLLTVDFLRFIIPLGSQPEIIMHERGNLPRQTSIAVTCCLIAFTCKFIRNERVGLFSDQKCRAVLVGSSRKSP